MNVVKFVLAVLVALAVVVPLAGCAPARADDVSSKDTVKAFVGELSAKTSANGQVLPQREAALSFGTPGRVTHVFVDVGDAVNAGDVLVQIESDALQRAVRNAELNLATQEANLADLREGASAAAVAAARAAVASAQAQLDDLLAGPSAEELADAEATLASAQAQLDDLLSGPSAEELAQARAALASAQAAEEAEAARHAVLDDQLAVARLELDLAAADLESAQYFYDALKNDWQHKDYADFSPEAETLRDAQAAYDVALARYNLTAVNINDSALRSARSQVAQAEASLEALIGDKTVEMANARAQVAQAEASLEALIEEHTAQIASARAQLAQAEADLANLLEGTAPETLAIAQAQVEQGHIQLADAQARLAEATLVAPFDGLVTAVYVDQGELSSGLVVEMVDTGSLEVVLDVDEVDIGSIVLGQQTLITLETWPERELEGEVTAIAPKAQTASSVVHYQVHISLDVADLPVRAGMTANADLIASRREDVLLVANKAITADRDAGTYHVYRVEGDKVEKVEIAVGLRDNAYTEVTAGLREGDELVLDYVQETTIYMPGPGAASAR
jgi:HlyD family secretion protein